LLTVVACDEAALHATYKRALRKFRRERSVGFLKSSHAASIKSISVGVRGRGNFNPLPFLSMPNFAQMAMGKNEINLLIKSKIFNLYPSARPAKRKGA